MGSAGGFCFDGMGCIMRVTTGAHLASTWVTKQWEHAKVRCLVKKSQTFINANDERFALAA